MTTKTAPLPAPQIEYVDLIIAGQNATWQAQELMWGHKVRYQIKLDKSYTHQSRMTVQVWMDNQGWTEVWTVDPAGIEKQGGPDHKAIMVRTINNALIELHREAWTTLN